MISSVIVLLRIEHDCNNWKNDFKQEIMYLCRWQQDVAFLLATSVDSSCHVYGTGAGMHMHRCTCDCRKLASSLSPSHIWRCNDIARS